ncbi:MAG: DNA alkylation repair protein, partial [Sarcina sp.]
KYREFMKGLTPDMGLIYGVRIPILRKIAKDISKNENINELKIILLNAQSHEEKLIYVYLIQNTKYKDFESFLVDIESFVPKINNWSVNDSLCSAAKKTAKKFESEYFAYTKENLKSENPWRIRFGLISLKCTFAEVTYIDEIIRLVAMIKSDHYYVKMGIAWLLSTCYLKDSEKIKQFLANNILDKWVQNKTIQKIGELTRVSSEEKIEIKKYRL